MTDTFLRNFRERERERRNWESWGSLKFLTTLVKKMR